VGSPLGVCFKYALWPLLYPNYELRGTKLLSTHTPPPPPRATSKMLGPPRFIHFNNSTLWVEHTESEIKHLFLFPYEHGPRIFVEGYAPTTDYFKEDLQVYNFSTANGLKFRSSMIANMKTYHSTM
jgi:hypothetical protein